MALTYRISKMSNTKLQDQLRQCANDPSAGNPFWIDNARQLMLWAADAIDAADSALSEQCRKGMSGHGIKEQE
jgi:hypothetical protein